MREFWDAPSITRFKLTKLDDSGDHQRLSAEGYSGETFTDVARAQPHGSSSNPPQGAVGWGLRMGASDRLLMLGFETANRPKNLRPGEQVLYDSSGNVIFCKTADGIRITAATGTVEITRGSMKIIISDNRIDLGGPGGARVATEAGFSNKVFAVL